MPEATPFNGGRGNGFASCLDKVDVNDRGDGSPYDYWTTLSGVNSDSPIASAADISDSLVIAMSLFWNLNEVRGSTVAKRNAETISETYATVGIFNFTPGGSSDDPLAPRERACRDNLSGREVSLLSDNRGEASVTLTLLPVRMYNGDTSDEEKFVGYGFSGNRWALVKGKANTDKATLAIGSFVKTEPTDLDEDIAYTTIGNVHVICHASGDENEVDANGLTASFSRSAFGETWSGSVSLTELDFYTT